MNPLDWILWSSLCGAGSGILVYFVMQSRTEVLLSRQREDLAAAKAALRTYQETLDSSLENAEQSGRRKALDEFMSEIRVEERYYIREQKALLVTRKSNMRQERVFFRNIPLSSWLEHEMSFEETTDPDKIAQGIGILALEAPRGVLREDTDDDTRAVVKQLRQIG